MNTRVAALTLGTAAVLFSIIGVTFAAGGLGPARYLSNQTILNAAMGQINCRVNATTGFLSDVSTAVPSLSSTMGNFSTALKGDQAQLQVYATAGSVISFRAYLRGTFDPELGTIAKSVVPDIRAANVSANTLKTLRANYNTTIGSERSCEYSALKVIAGDKIVFDEYALQTYTNETARLAAAGRINVSSLTAVISNANSTTLQPFIAAVNSATNASQLRAALGAYCLFDGCANGYNFHLAAHFDLQKLTLISQYASSNSIYDNVTVLGEVNTDLTNASVALAQVGTKQYAGSQSSVVWTNLGNASKLLHQLLVGHPVRSTTATIAPPPDAGGTPS